MDIEETGGKERRERRADGRRCMGRERKGAGEQDVASPYILER